MLLTVVLLIFQGVYHPSSADIIKNPDNNACKHLIEYPFRVLSSNCYVNLNVLSSTPEMIKLNGYELEEHVVVSKDGFRSKIFRIPPRVDDNRKRKQPVVLNHGILVNSAIWTWMGERSLGFVLADAGYDVWMVNQRDSGYTTHDVYKPSDYNFWNYSIDTIAANEFPQILKTVVDATNKSGSIIYISHSRGTTGFFMYAADFPEEVEKNVRGYIALAPVEYPDFALQIKIIFFLAKILYHLKVPSLFYPPDKTVKFCQKLCGTLPHLCKLILTLSSGRSNQFLADDLLAMFTFLPSPVSIKTLVHLNQLYTSKKFQKFDYGREGNLLEYNQEEPPLHNLSNIKIPVYMYYGKYDVYIKEWGVKRVYQELGSREKEYFSVPVGMEDDKWQFSHNDFCWSKYIEKFFYKDLFKTLDKLQPK